MAQSEDEAAVGLLNAMRQHVSKEGAADDAKVEESSNKNKDNSEHSKTVHKTPEEADPESGVMEFSEGQKSKVEKVEAKPAEDGRDETDALVTSFREFFTEEWKAFKTEKSTSWSEKKTEEVALDFDGIRKEWTYDPENEEHWVNQAKKQKESDTCSPLFYSILVGITFVVIPNGAILLDMLAASDYIGGTWYRRTKNSWLNTTAYANLSCSDPLKIPVGQECCRSMIESDGFVGDQVECFEQDPLWGSLTLLFLFIPGVFWSLGIFIQFADYLRKKNPERFDQKRVLFFFFVPAAALCTISFPLQLIIVSVIATFNTQVSLNKYEQYNFYFQCSGPLDHPDQQDRDSRGVLQCSLPVCSPTLHLLPQSGSPSVDLPVRGCFWVPALLDVVEDRKSSGGSRRTSTQSGPEDLVAVSLWTALPLQQRIQTWLHLADLCHTPLQRRLYLRDCRHHVAGDPVSFQPAIPPKKVLLPLCWGWNAFL